MMVDMGGLEDAAEGFFADASTPSSLLLDQDALGVEVQVPEEEDMDGPGVVTNLTAQKEAKLAACRKAFYKIPQKPPLQSVHGEPTTGVTYVKATRAAQCIAARRFVRA